MNNCLDTENKNKSTGYQSPVYAASLSEFGIPIELPESGGWILKRKIPGTQHFDVMGNYPIFSCPDWAQLRSDFESLADELVSLALVTDPFGNFDPEYLSTLFDVFYPYKDHFILDLSKPIQENISTGRRYHSRRALKKLNISLQISPNIDLDEWVFLYDFLIKKHNITGIRMFSYLAFEKQTTIPETYYFRALHNGEIVGGQLFFKQGDICFYHLSGYTPKGYKLHASYALMWSAIQFFQKKVRWINFGGGISTKNNINDGLKEFKRGWSSEIRKTYFCGKIFNQEQYGSLTNMKGFQGSTWFPAYRTGEYS